ncbi:unnamed protein product [Rhodiola kirilowii]
MSSHSTTRSDSASSMAKTPSDLSDQDSLKFISVDLVSAARKNIQLMRAVYESQWLRSRSALLEAVRRYEELWLPLISEFTAAPMILPPFDIEWVWFCHTLDPIGYRRYCELRFSKLIGKSAIFDEENEEYALMRCREIWSRMYPAEPLENQFDSLENSKDPISLNEDLVRAVLQHTELYSRFFEPYRCELVYLIAAKQRYKRFLHLLQGGAGACLSLVPASDISLMLLSHQSYPTAYARDGKEFESGLGKMVGIWMLPKPAEVKETKMLWDKAYNQPYEKAGGEIVVESENPNSAKLPVYWDVSDVDVSSKYRSLSPRFLLEVIVLVRLAHDRAKVQPDMGRDSLRLRMIRSHKELKIDKPVSSFPSDSWEKIWHLYPEFGTKGITLELRQLGTGCFKGNAAQETFGIHWNELLRAPSLTIEKVLERRVRVVVSVTPPIQAPYLLKCVPDKVTDDSGDMVCDEILKMNNYKPQEGRWLSRTVLDHAGRECFVLRLRVASGFWRRGAEVPLVVKWEDMITEILQGSWSYAAGSIGRAPGKLAGTASPKELSEEHKASWYLSTGSELVISWDSSSSILSLNFHLKDPTANDLSSVKLLKGRRMQEESGARFFNVGNRSVGVGGETKRLNENRGGDFLRFRENLFSLFVDNIPINRDERWVRALFNMVGQTMDVFIPARERKASRSRFGFVRYKSKGEAVAAIKRWNGANVGGAKLSVSLADDDGKPKASPRSRSGKGRLQEAGVARREAGALPGWKPKMARTEVASKGCEEAKEIPRAPRQKRRSVRLEVFQELEEWVQNSLVAEMKTIKLGEQIEKEMRSDGIAFVKIIPTGGRNVLIQFESLEDLEKCLVEDYGAVLRNFSKLQRWRDDMLSTTRTVWLSIIGLPFKAWTESNCVRLAAPYGECLKLDDRDVRFVGVGRARMLIETKCFERICESVAAEIGGKWYEIGICEECCLGGCEIDTPQTIEEEAEGRVDRISMSSQNINPVSKVCYQKNQTELAEENPEKDSCSNNGGRSSCIPSHTGEVVTNADGRRGSKGKGRSLDEEDDMSKFSNFESDKGTKEGDSRNTVRSLQVVPESDLQEEEVSRASKHIPGSMEIEKSGGTEGRGFRRDSHKEGKENIFVFSSMPSRASEPKERQLDKANTETSDQDDSVSLSEKYLNILKKERRKESKERKDVKYRRRKLLRAAVSKQLQVDSLNPGSMPIDKASDAEKGERCGKVRKEAENTFKIASRLGANGRKKQKAVSELKRSRRMDMVFIQETKIVKHEERMVAAMWGGEKMSWSSVDAEGNSGGLLTVWDPEFMLLRSEVKGKGFILVQGYVKGDQQPVLINLVNVYAPCNEKEKAALWESLVSLKPLYEGEWIVGGDFNSVLIEEERRGFKFCERDALLFQDFIRAMGLVDIPLIGKRFTWSNRNGASRLDRFLVTPGILSLWPKLEQKGLDKGPSDHSAIALMEEEKVWGAKPFRVLNVWLEHPQAKELIREAWEALEKPGWKGYTLQRKLSRVRVKLALWNKKGFGDIIYKLREARKEWERLNSKQDLIGLSEENFLKKSALQKRIWHLELQEERIWSQKSRIAWLNEGDQNTKFFHRSASWRASKNKISSILVDGNWIEEPGIIKQAAHDHFSAIFRKPSICSWELENVQFASVNDLQNEGLERSIDEEEIQQALRECDGNKAPGPDGFNMNFYKKHWHIVGEEVRGFIKEFCENGRLSKGINKTFLALIPKAASPQKFDEFRPISLVNSSYKILSKCLAKRLSLVLPHLISPNQSAFIANRNILDGIMVTNELIHTMKSEKRKALEVDGGVLLFSKDGGADQRFPLKGIRDGEGAAARGPLSPFLFLVAAEGLSRILDKAVVEGVIKGVDWLNNGDKLSHLQFADDTILFCRAEAEEVQNLRSILIAFGGCSGLKINFDKSLCFGIGLQEEEVCEFARLFNCPAGKFPMKYLGMPVGVNPAKLSTWKPVIQKFKDKLASWRGANLSMAGRLVLIKSALCSLPLYYASLFKIPIAVAQEMEKIQRQFLWGGSEARRKMHFVKWETVTKPKKFGGLGIQSLVEKNLALLTKWWWQLISGKGGLWRRMIIEKYGFNGLLDPSRGTVNPRRLSNSWKNILATVKGNEEVGIAFREGVILKLGRGNELSFWEDAWAGEKPFKDVYPKLFMLAVDGQAKVGESGLWVEGVWHWNIKFRRQLYQWEEDLRLELLKGLSHLQLKEEVDDKVVWAFSSEGKFSTNSLLKAASAIRSRKKGWEVMPTRLWLGIAPPKVEMLVWRIFLDSIPSKALLSERRILLREEDLFCVLCGGEKETSDHLFIHCEWSWRLWTDGLTWWGSSWVAPQSAKILLESWDVGGATKSSKRLGRILCYAVLWSIWEERNKRCFQNCKRRVEEIGELVKVRVAWWAKYRKTKCPYSTSVIKNNIEESTYESKKNAKSQNQAGKNVNEEENDEDGEEDGFITLVRITEEYPKGKATALLNWKLLAVEVLPEEDVVLALLICISILRSASRMRKEDIGGLLIRRRLKETKLGLRDWGSVVVHSSVPVSSPHVQPWYYCNAKEVIASDRSGSIARLPVAVQSSAEGAESLYRKAILG